MIRFIEVTSIRGIKVLINVCKIEMVGINELVNNQSTYVYFNQHDYIKVKETYEEIKQLIENASQDNSKNSKAPKMLEMLIDAVNEYKAGEKVSDGWYKEVEQLIKEATEI